MGSKVVLLPHPGGERLPPRGTLRVEWPSGGGHARKFVRARGDWAISTGASGSGWLEFWTEYEGPTVCELLPSHVVTPRAVHSIDSKPGRASLNTDPWVFHPGFVWSVCRHSALTAEIQNGDLVLFGSALGGNWV